MRVRSVRVEPRHLLYAAAGLLVLGAVLLWWPTGDAAEPGAAPPPTATQPEDPATLGPEPNADDEAFGGTDAPTDLEGLADGDPAAGLTGQGFSGRSGARVLELSVRADGAIGTVGYLVPTSAEHSYGIDEGVGSTWGLSTRVHGPPDYARVFIQSNLAGEPITCVVTVDGVETDRQTASGPYGQAMCQG